jgi:bis(5'-nucleosyl)-tetraphosphatase (symmetrical)
MRTIIIGDVHGCIEELEALITIVELRVTDRLAFVGDFMDRGPEPARCVRLARELGAAAVQSNHDEKHVRWRHHEEVRKDTRKKNPIQFSDRQVMENERMTEADIRWLAGLPMSLHLGGDWYAVHAGLEPCKTFAEQRDSKALLRTRFVNEDGTAYSAKDPSAPDPTDKMFWADRWYGPESIVYGHHIHRFLGPHVDRRHLAFRNSCVGIDTGCYAGGRLTAMVLMPDGSFHFEWVTARAVYEPLSDKYGPNRPKPLVGLP